MKRQQDCDQHQLPINCDCGCTETERVNEDVAPGIGTAEYDLHCAGCGRYLGHWEYGRWSY